MKIKKESNTKGGELVPTKSTTTKHIFSDKKMKSGDYMYGFAGHGGFSQDRATPLPYMTQFSSCQGIKEHPKTSSASSAAIP